MRYKFLILSLIITASLLLFIIASLIIFKFKPYNNRMKSVSSSDAASKKTSENQSKQKLDFKRDLNGDGTEETISVSFKYENKNALELSNGYTIDVTSGNKKYSYESNDENVIQEVHFADFDTEDNYTEFYINSEGPSDDECSTVYRFDGTGIKKVLNTTSYINYYDREGRIYTNFSSTNDKYRVLLSYYDIRKCCAVFIDKKNIIGRKIQFDNYIILFNDSKDGNNAYKSFVDDNTGEDDIKKIVNTYPGGSVVKLVKPNTEFIIIGMDNTNHGMFPDGNVKNIRLKVKAKDGSSGWIERMNGGD